MQGRLFGFVRVVVGGQVFDLAVQALSLEKDADGNGRAGSSRTTGSSAFWSTTPCRRGGQGQIQRDGGSGPSSLPALPELTLKS